MSLFVALLHKEKGQHLENFLIDLSVMKVFLYVFAPVRWHVCVSGTTHTFGGLWNPQSFVNFKIALKFRVEVSWLMSLSQPKKKKNNYNQLYPLHFS